MTRLFNDPAKFADEMLEGFFDIYSNYVMPVAGGMVRSTQSPDGKVAVVVGGGSGHYPAFYGVCGYGFTDGAVVGNIFTSPSTLDVYNVARNADHGGGVLLITGNYAGDVLNFQAAKERLNAEGIKTEYLWTTDDVASAKIEEKGKRRGIAGTFVVFKAAGAAAEAGLDLASVLRVATKANDRTRTFGVGFSGCTLPGGSGPLFSVPEGLMELGLGIHGEPGLYQEKIPTAHELALKLVSGVAEELKEFSEKKIAVILNGLGNSKYEELFVLWRTVNQELRTMGYEIIEPEVGELVTSLDMAGVSLSITVLDEELESFWRAPANTPAYKKGSAATGQTRSDTRFAAEALDKVAFTDATAASKVAAKKAKEAFDSAFAIIESSAEELGRIDAVAGDGDHGRGMLKGASAAKEVAEKALADGAGVSGLIQAAAVTWAARAGGTSGVLWGAALEALASGFDDTHSEITSDQLVKAIRKAVDKVSSMGKASLGDKTMLDAAIPFIETLEREFAAGKSLNDALKSAAQVAKASAEATASLVAKIGRARPLAERSIGTPDAGAISFALIAEAIANQ
jgi:D-erythrulose 4-kinase